MSGAHGPGRLILIVGPSGAGKDTLISQARLRLRDDPNVVFPRRLVTRAANEAEDHDSLTPAGFETARRNGHFALDWEAHGLNYAIPSQIEDDLRAGRTVVCNVSRKIVDAARRRYPVTAVMVTAPAELLLTRLSARGRESEEAVRARVERGLSLSQAVEADVTIENGSDVESALKALLEVLAPRTSRRA